MSRVTEQKFLKLLDTVMFPVSGWDTQEGRNGNVPGEGGGLPDVRLSRIEGFAF